jgi:hypothetical protein
VVAALAAVTVRVAVAVVVVLEARGGRDLPLGGRGGRALLVMLAVTGGLGHVP